MDSGSSSFDPFEYWSSESVSVGYGRRLDVEDLAAAVAELVLLFAAAAAVAVGRRGQRQLAGALAAAGGLADVVHALPPDEEVEP